MLDDIEIIEEGIDDSNATDGTANDSAEAVEQLANQQEDDKSSRISDADEIMADVELVMTREINPDEIEAELEKSKKKKKKNVQAPVNNSAIKPEERRAMRRQKRKHDRTVAVVVLCIILLVLAAGGIFGKYYFDSWINGRVKEPEIVAVPTPEIEEIEVIDFTPAIEVTPEIEEIPEEITPEVVEEPEATAEELLDEMIDEMIAEMPLEDKVAGLFIITPESLTGQSNVTKSGDGTKAALEQYPVGGIIYFKSNITGADQLKEMISNTQSFSKYPLFFAVDEEGGAVARVQSGLKLDKTPTAKELGEAGDTAAVYSTYNTIGNYLTEYGFNLDFAPVADVLTNPDNTAIGNRSFSSDSETVAKMIPEAVKGLQDSGVSACLKHWPGQGDVDADTHEGLAATGKTKAEMESLEFQSFKAGIEAGVDMIMVGHFAAPEITGDNTPCSLSKDVITGILRDELEYNGIIITDALNMSAISEYYGADEAAVKALKAGCDMVLMPEDFTVACEGVVAAVNDGRIDEQRINDSLKRVYRVKYADTLQ